MKCPQCGSPADLGLVRVYCSNAACVHADRAVVLPSLAPPGGEHLKAWERVCENQREYDIYMRSYIAEALHVAGAISTEDIARILVGA